MELLERDAPLRSLGDSLREARTGVGRIALVCGEAGIGKTALVETFIAAHRTEARLLLGRCDALFTPQPLAPLHDVALQANGALLQLMQTAGARLAIFSAVVRELQDGGRPTVLVFEDVHWADAATLDLLKYLGRRIRAAPTLVILTYRDDELDGGHALWSMLGNLPADAIRRVPVAPLTEAAVARLARHAGRSAAGVHAQTGGNPFYVTELLASPSGSVPVTVREATLARAELRMGDPAGHARLERSLELALMHESHEHAARAYTNLADQALIDRGYARADQWFVEGLAYTRERDLDSWMLYMQATRARAHLERGLWQAAEEDASAVLAAAPAAITRVVAVIVLGLVRLRQGHPDAEPLLDEARALALVTGDIMRIGPMAAARAEAARLKGDQAQMRAEVEAAYELALRHPGPWRLGELALWLWRAGTLDRAPDAAAAPYRLEIGGDWQAAAAAWQKLGCPYEQALALAQGDRPAQLQALEILTMLGAGPAVALVRRDLRAAGLGPTFSGVARDAQLISIQIFSQLSGPGCFPRPSPCATALISDLLRGLERVLELSSSFDIAAVNLSLGGGSFSSHCDNDVLKLAIDELRAAGIATVVASGNDGADGTIARPACISSAIAVGSTTKRNFLSVFSDHADIVDLLAPGSFIRSSVPGARFAVLSGTSMATPHVAGAFAILRSVDPFATVDELETALTITRRPIARAGVIKPRIKVAAAVDALLGFFSRPFNDNFGRALALTDASGVSFSWNVDATAQIEEPVHAGVGSGDSVWWRWRAPQSGTATVSTFGSDFDTVLAVYTGPGVAQLTEIASNDDSPGTLQSQVQFPVTAGGLYRIAVDSFDFDDGKIVLNYSIAGAGAALAMAEATSSPK